jgi:hypothetical protein
VTNLPLWGTAVFSNLSGDVVRWAPDELSFATAAAWKDIYTQRKSGKTFVKDHKFYMTDDSWVSKRYGRRFFAEIIHRLRAPHLINMQDPVKHAQAKKIFVCLISSLSRSRIFD